MSKLVFVKHEIFAAAEELLQQKSAEINVQRWLMAGQKLGRIGSKWFVRLVKYCQAELQSD